MLGASCSKEKVKRLTVPRLYMYVISVCYFYFSPVIDQQTIVFLILISLFHRTKLITMSMSNESENFKIFKEFVKCAITYM